jgi:type IV secretion system protein VirB2
MMETPLQLLQQSLSGPVALAIGIIAFCLAGAVLIFKGELTDFAKRACYVVLVLAVLLTANSLVMVLFPASTATIA